MTQYWALHPLGPWAEFLRAHDIRDPEEVLDVRHRVWAGRFDLESDQVARVDFDLAGDFGISPGALVGEDLAPCQDLGEELRRTHEALVVPSAALPGTFNLVVFGPRLAIPYDTRPIDVDQDVAVGVSADGAHPPRSLVTLVRFTGAEHAGLRAWNAGESLEPVPGIVGLP